MAGRPSTEPQIVHHSGISQPVYEPKPEMAPECDLPSISDLYVQSHCGHLSVKDDGGSRIMLNISGQTMERMVKFQSAEMIDKIANWLQHEMRGWRCLPGSQERDKLEKICRLARDFGMDVETDYALFALLVISRKPAADYFDNQEVKEAMTDTSRNPASKLLWLEAQLGGNHASGDAGLNSNGKH